MNCGGGHRMTYMEEIEKLLLSVKENYMEADKMRSISDRILYLLTRIKVEAKL